MNAFQGIIEVSKGKIIMMKPKKGAVVVQTDFVSYEFSDAWLYPGFVDSHCHLLGLGNQLNGLTFNNCLSPEECINKAVGYKYKRGDWIFGRGWNQEKWHQKKYPDKSILDRYFPDVPVCFKRIDGHAAWVNSIALKIACITNESPQPKGGEIIKNENNEPTGILIDSAMSLVESQIPKRTIEQTLRNISFALDNCSSMGLTEIHDMDLNPDLIPIYQDMADNNELTLRINGYVRGQEYEWKNMGIIPMRNDFFSIIGIKFYVDGALGSWGAAMQEPYSDNVNKKGLLFFTFHELFERVEAACNDGFDIAVHAIGDEANKLVLDVYQKIRQKGYKNVLRMEHAQIVKPEDIIRFKELNVIASVQGIHYVSDFLMAIERIGADRMKYAYPWNSFLKNNVVMCSGSDFPIESNSAIAGIDALVRRSPQSKSNYRKSVESLSILQAINSYNLYPSFVSQTSARRGKLDLFYDADFTILNKNLFKTRPEDLLDTIVLSTFCDGKPTFNLS